MARPAMRGSITDEDRSFVETWENIASYQNVIIRLDTRGDERQEVINGRRKFMLTAEERIITQDRIVDPKHDPFRNGSFRPVIVPDSINIESNPNAISDEDIAGIFQASDLAFDEWLKTIDSAQTLRRMADLAPDSEISMKRYKAIEARYRVVKPATRLETNDDQLKDFLSDRPKSSTNSADAETANPRRGRGGRSSDYRSS
jgi:hypothetical protein